MKNERLYANNYRQYLLLFFRPETVNLINLLYCYQLIDTGEYISMSSDMRGNWRISTSWDTYKQCFIEVKRTFTKEQVKELFYTECYLYENK